MPTIEVDKNNERVTAICFSHGTIKDNDIQRLDLNCFKQAKSSHSKSNEQEKCIVKAEIDSMTYVGTDASESNRFHTNTCDYYLAVINKRSNKVRVHEASLIQLEPWLEDKTLLNGVNDTADTFKDKKNALTREFGSGKSQRALNKRLKNALDDEMIASTTKSIMTVSSMPSGENEENVETAEAVKKEILTIPPHNKDAEKPEDVYKLEDIIPLDLMPTLAQHSEMFLNCRLNINIWRVEKKYFTTVLDQLDRLSLREDARLVQCQSLLYLQYLMETYNMKSAQLRNRNPLPKEWPDAIKNHILQMFTLEVKEGKKFRRCVPSRMKDLLLSYIIALCLIITQFTLPLGTLMTDLQLPQRRLSLHATTLGCTIKKAKTSNGAIVIAVLNVPLTFPVVKGKTEKKKIF